MFSFCVFSNIGLYCLVDGLAWLQIFFFDVSLIGHSECVSFVKKFNLPLLVSLYQFMFAFHLCFGWFYTNGLLSQVTGGGGYTKENVARCWTVETGVLLDTELPNGISQPLFKFWIMTCYTKISFSFVNGIEYFFCSSFKVKLKHYYVMWIVKVMVIWTPQTFEAL